MGNKSSKVVVVADDPPPTLVYTCVRLYAPSSPETSSFQRSTAAFDLDALSRSNLNTRPFDVRTDREKNPDDKDRDEGEDDVASIREITSPAAPIHKRNLSELVDPILMATDGFKIKSPSGNLLDREDYFARQDRPLCIRERQERIRQQMAGRASPLPGQNVVTTSIIRREECIISTTCDHDIQPTNLTKPRHKKCERKTRFLCF